MHQLAMWACSDYGARPGANIKGTIFDMPDAVQQRGVVGKQARRRVELVGGVMLPC